MDTDYSKIALIKLITDIWACGDIIRRSQTTQKIKCSQIWYGGELKVDFNGYYS